MGIAIHPTANLAVVANHKEDKVSILDLNTYSVTATIGVGKDPAGVAIDPNTNTALITNKKDNTLTIIDLSANTSVNTLPMGADPSSVVINSASRRAFISNEKGDSVTVIDLDTQTLIGEIQVGQNPHGVDVNPDTHTLVVTNEKEDQISIIDLDSILFTTTSPTGDKPQGVAIDTIANMAIIANEKSDNVTLIDLATGQPLSTIPVGKNPKAVAASPENGIALVSSEKENNLSIIDLRTRSLINTIGTGKSPQGVAIDPVRNIALVANHKDDTVSIIDLGSNTLLASVAVGRGPYGIAVNPNNRTAIVTSEKDDSISIIDLSTDSVTATIGVSKKPTFIAVNPDTNQALVAGEKNDTLTLIDLATNTIAASLQAGRDTKGIAINPITNIALISNHKDNTVNLLDMNTRNVTNTVLTGEGPYGVAVNTATNTAVITNEEDDTISIVHLPDTIPPDILITTPQDGAILNSSILNVTGTVTDIYGQIESVTVNNTAAARSDGTFQAAIQLLEGENTITVTASDDSGNTRDAIITVTIDATPPQISITGILDNQVTNQNLIPVITVSDVYLDTQSVTLNGQPYVSGTTIAAGGTYTLSVTATDRAGNVSSAIMHFTIDKTPPLLDTALITASDVTNMSVTVTGSAGAAEPGSRVTITNTRTGDKVVLASDSSGAFTANIPADYGDLLSIVAVDAAGNVSTEIIVEVVSRSPAAAAIQEGSFGYTYRTLVPLDVAIAGYTPERFSVITGVVQDILGNPLQGVLVQLHNHPEYGTVLTDAQGRYSMPADGGGLFIVDFSKPGFLMSQRPVQSRWNQIHAVDTVTMISADDTATNITLNGNPSSYFLHHSTPVTDADGTRRATLVFQGDTTGTVTHSDGTVTSLQNTITVRATEFARPDAMPRLLPPSSAFTYAVDLTLDGVDPLSTVRFSQPVAMYVDNFLGFPAGEKVPLGYYDRNRTVWVPSNNGVVVRLLDTDNDGLVDSLDSTGDGVPDDIDRDGSVVDEVAGIAGNSSFAAGATYWRVTVDHFTPWDLNWPYDLPPDAELPPATPPTAIEERRGEPENKIDSRHGKNEQKECTGSSVTCESGIFEDDFPVPGTQLALHYQSSRTEGYKYRIAIPVTGGSIPSSLSGIKVDVWILGRRFHYDVPVLANQEVEVLWDGMDYLGNRITGDADALVRITFEYPLVYRSAGGVRARAFGEYGNVNALSSRASIAATVMTEYTLPVKTSSGLDLAGISPGWSFTEHHKLIGDQIYRGDGEATPFIKGVISTVAGNGQWGFGGDGGVATDAQLADPIDIAAGPDGSLYILGGNAIRRLGPDGIISTILPFIPGPGSHQLSAMDIGPDESLYIADRAASLVYRLGPDGMLETVAGNGGDFFNCYAEVCFDGPATERVLGHPQDVSASPDGNIYIAIADGWLFSSIRRVGPDGIMTTLNDSPYTSPGSGYDGFIRSSRFNGPRSIATGPDGSLYIADADNHIIRRISPDGQITTIAGMSSSPGFSGDGGPARYARLRMPYSIATGADGSIYFTDAVNQRIRRITPDGIIDTVVGNGVVGFTGDGIPSILSSLNSPNDIAMGPDGSLYIADRQNYRVRKVTPGDYSNMVDLAIGERFMGDRNRNEGYVFDQAGRHLRTIDLDTGVTLLSFGYDSEGDLSSITDRFSNVTTIHRTGGVLTAIESPDGIVTAIDINGGHLAGITYPDGTGYQYSYTPDGLMTNKVNPNGGVFTYTHDGYGRVVAAQDAAGGVTAFSRSLTGGLLTAVTTDPEGRSYSAVREERSTGAVHIERRDKAGVMTVIDGSSGGLTSTVTGADGTFTITEYGIDPVYFTKEEVSRTVSLPSGLTRVDESAVGYTDGDADGVIDSVSRAMTVNGRMTSLADDLATGTLTTTSPSGRTLTTRYDLTSLLTLQESAPGLAPTDYSYDSRGRLATVTRGSGSWDRVTTITYDNQGRVGSLTDPANRSTGFTYDAMGRLTLQTLPDGRSIGYTYDAKGNVTSVTPPGRPAHLFAYTPADLQDSYTPPDAGTGATATVYAYNLAKELTRITRPDGQTVSFGYDSGARLSSVTLPGGTLTYGYDPVSGNLASVTASDGGMLSYTYDGFLATSESWTGAVTGSVSFGYDSDFRVNTLSINGGHTTGFSYDADGLLIQAGALTISRDSGNGLITGTSIGSITDVLGYNGFSELETYRAGFSGAPLYEALYSRDALGRVVQKIETISGISNTYDYTYDIAGRLTEVRKDGVITASYGYDANGNRISVMGPGGTVTGSTDAQDRLISYGSKSYTYTANGELSGRTDTATGETTAYQYDVLGNLRGVSLPDGRSVEYISDGENRRIGKKVNGVLMQGLLYKDGLNPVAELDGAGNVVSTFVYGTKSNVPDFMIKGGATYRMISDHLGSPRLIVDTGTGAITQRMDYDDFGNVTQDTNPGFQPFGFAGGIYDPDTRLVRYGARDYDPETGRWTAKDPILFAGGETNLYGYVGNNPVNWVDPLGLWYVDIGANIPIHPIFGGVSIDLQIGPGGVMLVPGVYIGTPGGSVMIVTGDPTSGFQSSISGGYGIGGSFTTYGQSGLNSPYSAGIGVSTPGAATEVFQYGISPKRLIGYLNSFFNPREQENGCEK